MQITFGILHNSELTTLNLTSSWSAIGRENNFQNGRTTLRNVAIQFSANCQNDNKRGGKEEKKQEEFECPQGAGNGNFADPATCRRFYQVNRYTIFFYIFLHIYFFSV